MEQTTQSAAVHNIVAEEEIGMMSAALKRSPAAYVIFHSSIIKCVKNETIHFLEQHPLEYQEKFVKLSIHWARKSKDLAKLETKEVHLEIVRRVAQKYKEAAKSLKRGEQRTLKRQRLGIEDRVKALQLTDNSDIERALECDADAKRLIQDIMGGQRDCSWMVL